MNVTVEQSDIKRIGHTHYQDKNGRTIIVCNINTANIEEILLRNILLKGFHREFSIVEVESDFYENDIKFITDLPWDLYMEI